MLRVSLSLEIIYMLVRKLLILLKCAGSMDKTIKVYDLNNLKCLQTLTSHQSNVYTLLPTESTLFSGNMMLCSI